jgi:hypothetical protein
MIEEIEQLLAFGRMGLETGYYEQARDSFEQVLALDPSNREAMKGFARANEMLSRREAVEPGREEPARPTYTAEPQRTVPGMSTQEWPRSPVEESQERSRVHKREDSMESKADESLQWLSLQLRHVPIKTWIIVLAKIGVAVMCWLFILAVIKFVYSLILAQIDISIAEVWSDFLEMVR